MDTGFPASDAQTDFSRARREHALARLTARLRGEPSDFDVILPFEEVVAELGWAGQRSLGLQSIPLDSIVGTVDRSKEFDREFRPTSGSVRGAGSASPRHSDAGATCRRSRSTGSVTSTSSRTATTGCRSRGPRAGRTSTPT